MLPCSQPRRPHENHTRDNPDQLFQRDICTYVIDICKCPCDKTVQLFEVALFSCVQPARECSCDWVHVQLSHKPCHCWLACSTGVNEPLFIPGSVLQTLVTPVIMCSDTILKSTDAPSPGHRHYSLLTHPAETPRLPGLIIKV